MAVATPERPASPTTERARALVADRRPAAEALGRDLAERITDPDDLVAVLAAGLDRLADPAYLDGQRRVAPGIGPLHGVRSPLLTEVERAFRRATRHDAPSLRLAVADRLLRCPTMEEHWLAAGILIGTLSDDPERSWQLLRRSARLAGDWISVDVLARPCATGILAEPYRWAELEQLVFSPSRWERRLVGSTIATIPFVDRRRGREPEVASRGLAILDQLIGDAEPDVQKALSWALRSLTRVDLAAVTGWCRRHARTAVSTSDGYRAWVVRDALTSLAPATAATLRDELRGVRRRPGAPSTSPAARTAARFVGPGGLPDPADLPEPPL